MCPFFRSGRYHIGVPGKCELRIGAADAGQEIFHRRCAGFGKGDPMHAEYCSFERGVNERESATVQTLYRRTAQEITGEETRSAVIWGAQRTPNKFLSRGWRWAVPSALCKKQESPMFELMSAPTSYGRAAARGYVRGVPIADLSRCSNTSALKPD
jgi:hypothetical protein